MTRHTKWCVTCGGTCTMLEDAGRWVGAVRGTCVCPEALVAFQVHFAPVAPGLPVGPVSLRNRLRRWWDRIDWQEWAR